MTTTLSFVIAALILLIPGQALAFQPHEYSGIYLHHIGRVFYLVSCIVVLWAIVRNRLQQKAGWRYMYYSVLLFAVWDVLVSAGRFAELWIEPSQFIGGKAGWDYFQQGIQLEGKELFFYIARFDFLVINGAMCLFYLGLREHLAQEEQASTGAAVILPLLPIYVSDMGGAAVFIVLSVMCLSVSLKLHRKEPDNVLWNYFVWLSSSYLLYSVSRSFGHFLRHILAATGNDAIWAYMNPYSGSINSFTFIIVGSVNLFFIWIYRVYLKMLQDKKEIELINTDLTELNQELENLVAERTMALMGLTVADKVRNPAAIIGCTCKRILAKEKLSEKLGENIHDIMDECQKLETIVGDFEGFLKSRQSMFRFEDINDIVRDVSKVIEREALDRDLHLVLNLPSDKPLKINTQKNHLRAAIFHIARNAIEATGKGGTVTITTSGNNDVVSLDISDTGHGISKEVRDKMFVPFFSTKALKFGMGLSLVKQIVSEHLGEIKVMSEVGKGTTFSIVFPVRWTEKQEMFYNSFRTTTPAFPPAEEPTAEQPIP
jgi:signal transduction histidine kinase